jgi:hypothetical protein
MPARPPAGSAACPRSPTLTDTKPRDHVRAPAPRHVSSPPNLQEAAGVLLCSIRERGGEAVLTCMWWGLGHSKREREVSPAVGRRAHGSHIYSCCSAPPRCSGCLPPAAAAHQGLTKTAALVGTPRQWLPRAPWRPLRVVGTVEPQAEPPQLVPRNTQLLFSLLRRMTFRFPAQPSLSALDAKVAT